MTDAEWIARLPERCCGRCEYWYTFGAYPPKNKRAKYFCHAPYPAGFQELMDRLPNSTVCIRNMILAGDGQTCPCFKPRAEVTP